jgi:hypothetical protein
VLVKQQAWLLEPECTSAVMLQDLDLRQQLALAILKLAGIV